MQIFMYLKQDVTSKKRVFNIESNHRMPLYMP